MKRQLFVCAVSLLLAVVCGAQPVTEPDEQVVMIPKKGLFTIELETAIYKPLGEGPFPLALINHGKSPGDTRFQSRYRPMPAVRYFLQRGYVVAVPMRQGFSKSTGVYIGGGCNVESNGRTQAEDVVTALDSMTALPYVDKCIGVMWKPAVVRSWWLSARSGPIRIKCSAAARENPSGNRQ